MADNHDLSQDQVDESSRFIQRRRRPPLSCTECRRRKLKCDRSLPCGQCVRSKTAESCVFVGPQPGAASGTAHRMSPPVSRTRVPTDSYEQTGDAGGVYVFDSKLGPKPSSNRVSKQNSSSELHELQQRLRTLERAVSKPQALQTPETSVCDVLSEVTPHDTDVAGVDDRVRFLPDSSFRGKHGKTRYFGRSHYTTTVSFVGDPQRTRFALVLTCPSFKILDSSSAVAVRTRKTRNIRI